MSFISPSRLSTCAKIAFFEQPQSSRRRKSKSNSNSTNSMGSSSYKKLHNQGDFPTHGNTSPRSARSPLGIMLSPNYWPHGSPNSVELSSSSSPSPLPMVTPERTETDNRSVVAEVSPPTTPVSSTDNVFSELHQHVLELVPKDTQKASREEKFQLLQTKLHMIQHGLLAIEHERKDLVEKCQRLESEKQKVKKQLENREREILTLSKRCAEQTAQVKEATLIRREHRDLNSQVEELKHELSKSDIHECHVFKDLKQQLLECQQERDQLRRRLETIQKDYDKVSDSLQECMQKIAVLNSKQQQWHYAQAMHERATNQQRLQHTMVVQRLQRTLQSREDEIERLQQVLKSTLATHERQLGELEARHGVTMSEMQQEHQSRWAELTQQHESMQQEWNDQLHRLKSELVQRDELIATLEHEVETNLERLMSVNTVLHQAEEDSSMFQALTADIEALQQNQESLEEQIHDRDIAIAELSAQVIRLELEQRLEAESSVTNTTELERAHQEIRDLRTQLQSMTESRSSSDGSQREQVQSLSLTLNDAGETIQQLQKELERSRGENLRLSQALENERLEMLTTTTETASQPGVESELVVLESQIVELVNELKQLKTALALRDDEIRDLRVIELVELEEKLAESRQEAMQLSAQLAAQEADLESYRSKSFAVPEDSHVSRENGDVVDGLDETIIELNEELVQQRATMRAQERQLKEVSADVSILSQQLAVKQQAETNLRTESRELQSMLDALQGDYDKLTLLAADLEKDRSKTQEQNVRLEAEVLERTNQLNDLCTRIKQLEASETAVQGKSSLGNDQRCISLQARLLDYEHEMERQQLDWSQKEVEYLNELNDERNRRESLERQAKDLHELGKENASLKAKIQQQEALLQRKMEVKKILGEKSNSARFGLSVRHASNGGRATHRSTASQPTLETFELGSFSKA